MYSFVPLFGNKHSRESALMGHHTFAHLESIRAGQTGQKIQKSFDDSMTILRVIGKYNEFATFIMLLLNIALEHLKVYMIHLNISRI